MDTITNCLMIADFDRLQEAYTLFRWALTVVGIGIGLVGVGMFFYRPKKESRQSTFTARLAALISFASIGIGTTLYAWIWFGR